MTLARGRDQMRRTMHPATTDAKAERKWKRIQRDLAQAERATGEAFGGIHEGIETAVDDVSDAYKRIRSVLSARAPRGVMPTAPDERASAWYSLQEAGSGQAASGRPQTALRWPTYPKSP